MRILFITFISSLVMCLAVHADKRSECLKALQRCYDNNIFAIEEFIDSADITKIGDACMLYSSAMKCIETLPCEKTNEFKKKARKLTKTLTNDVSGGCLLNGQLDPCLEQLVACEVIFLYADEDLNNHNASAGCLEVAAFDSCLKNAEETCPGRAVSDVMHEWQPLNKDAHREGCDINCNDALSECTFDLYVSDATDKEDYCSALKETQSCLKKTQEDVGCSDADSQNYLTKAIKQKASKYSSQCDGASPSAQISLLLVLVATVVSLLNKLSQ